jgi:hypothetical protein
MIRLHEARRFLVRMLLTGASLTIALTALGYAQDASPSKEMKLPGEILKLRENFLAISSSTILDAEVKEASKRASDQVENEFRKIWDPLKLINDKMVDLGNRIQIHNDTPHQFEIPAQQAQNDAYNREKAQLDKEQAEIKSEFMGSGLVEKLTSFLESPLVKETTRTTEQLLHPPVYFNYGLAYIQLKGIADGTLDWDGRRNVVSGDGTISIDSMPLEIKNSPGRLEARKGFVCIEDGDFAAAKAWFEQALLKDPDNSSLKLMAEFCRKKISRR